MIRHAMQREVILLGIPANGMKTISVHVGPALRGYYCTGVGRAVRGGNTENTAQLPPYQSATTFRRCSHTRVSGNSSRIGSRWELECGALVAKNQASTQRSRWSRSPDPFSFLY